MQKAVSAEFGSEHPLGKTIVARAKEKRIKILAPRNFTALFGKGVIAEISGKKVLVRRKELVEKLQKEGKTVMFVAEETKVLGAIALADTLKSKTKKAIEDLQKMGFKTIMLTGDNERTAKVIAKRVGIDDVIAEVLPDEKVNIIKKLQKEGKVKVAMVGDGINDAPALTQANVGIAIGSGTDIAIEAGEITLVGGEWDALVEAIKLSQAAFRTVRQNFFWTFFYNTMTIPAAAFGILATMIGPIIAASAMALSSLLVVLNSLRLGKMK